MLKMGDQWTINEDLYLGALDGPLEVFHTEVKRGLHLCNA